jgi:hypothetical protein
VVPEKEKRMKPEKTEPNMHTGTATGAIVPTSGQIAPATDALCPSLLDEAKPQTHRRRRRKESLIFPPAAKMRSENVVRLLPAKYKTAFAIPKPRPARSGPSHFRISAFQFSAFSPDPPIPGCAIIQPPLQKYFQLFRRPMENSNF